MKLFGARNKFGIKRVQLQYSKAMVSSQKLNLLLLPEPEPCTNHALTLTSVAWTPHTSLGGKSRNSVPGSKLVTEICCDKNMRKPWHVYNMAAERTMTEGAMGKKHSSLLL